MAAAGGDHRRLARSPSPPPDPQAPSLQTSRTRLHGFSFPPTLSWGTHRLLRCSKTNPASSQPPSAPDAPSGDTEKPNKSAGGSPRRNCAPQRPWNLRARPSATAAQPPPARSDEAAEVERPPSPTTETKIQGFSVELSKEEIADDFAVIRGMRPPRRPKKRPRVVQREVQLLYPGLSLEDATLDSYKIEEN